MKDNYRIKEVRYDNDEILFFAQHLEAGWFKKHWVVIGNPEGHFKIETAKKEIDNHIRFYNPPKTIETKIHKI